jgi:cytochrome bd-type quinol oxidase subunit 2
MARAASASVSADVILRPFAAAIFPVMLKSAGDPALSLTAFNAASRASALGKALYWWPVGFVLAVGYVVFLFRRHRERVRLVTDHDGY